MNTGSGFLLIVVGLLLLYAVITGKLQIIENAFYQLFGITPSQTESEAEKKNTNTPVVPTIGQGNISLPQIFIPDYTK